MSEEPTRTIHRTFCGLTDRQTRITDSRPIPLHVAPCRNGLVESGFDLWYEVELVDLDAPRGSSTMVVSTVGTGHPIPDDAGDYLGTVITPAGFVWHIYVRVVVS